MTGPAEPLLPHPSLRYWRAPLLLACDGLALMAAAAIAYFAWALPVRGQPPDLYWQLLPLIVMFYLAYARLGLYPGFGLGGVEVLRRMTLGTSFVFLTLAALSFAIKLPPVYSRGTFGIALVTAWILVPACRYLLLLLGRSWDWWTEPALVLGCGKQAERTITSLRRALTLGYRPVGVLRLPSEEDDCTADSVAGCPILGGLERAHAMAQAGIRVILVVDEGGSFDLSAHLDELQARFRHVIWIRGGGEKPVEGLELKNLGGVVGVEFVNQLLIRRNRALKRTFDLVLGIPLALVAATVMIPAALAVKLSSRGPIFFSQEREGLHGKPIRVWKLRTMYVDAEERLERLLSGNPEARRQWEDGFKLDSDPRIVRGVGWFLRRFSIDELPQLWQVLPGTLSLVGPRPFPSYHLEGYHPTILNLRRRVRPGVTGLWQVKIRSRGGLEQQQSHDAYYIRNWSFWMDLYVLANTIFAVLHGRGAT